MDNDGFSQRSSEGWRPEDGTPNKATENVKEVLFRLLHASRNAEEWDYWLRCKDRHYRWEAFKLAQAYMFGKPVQSVASEELAPPIKIDVSAIPSYREPAD